MKEMAMPYVPTRAGDVFYEDRGRGASVVLRHHRARAAAGPYFGISPGGSPGLVDWTTRMIVDTPTRVLLETLRITSNADMHDELADLRLPVLIVHGDLDASAPIGLTGRKTAALIPGATLKEYPGAGHGLYASDHQRLNADLLAFISAQTAEPAGASRGGR
jgi:non-heme chloroperoxidase